MDFGSLFMRAWDICWENKWLFLLGFLVALGSGAASTPQFNYSFSGNELPPGWEGNLERLLDNIAPLLIAAACALSLLGLLFWLVRLTAQAGLIEAAGRLNRDEKVRLGTAFRAGSRYLLRFVALSLLLSIPVWIVGILAFGGLVGSIGGTVITAMGVGSGTDLQLAGGAMLLLGLCATLLCCVGLLLWLFVALLSPFAQRAVVIEDLGVVASLRRGWQVLRDNLGDILLLALAFLLLGLLFGVVLSLVILPLGFLSAGPSLVNMMSGQSLGAGDIAFMVLGGLLIWLVSAAVNAVLTTYRSVTFTLAYQAFLGRTKPEPIGGDYG